MKMKSNSRSVKVPIEFHDFLNQIENNIRNQIGVPQHISEKIHLKSEIQRRIPLIFRENPTMMKRLIDINKRRKDKNVFQKI